MLSVSVRVTISSTVQDHRVVKPKTKSQKLEVQSIIDAPTSNFWLRAFPAFGFLGFALVPAALRNRRSRRNEREAAAAPAVRRRHRRLVGITAMAGVAADLLGRRLADILQIV